MPSRVNFLALLYAGHYADLFRAHSSRLASVGKRTYSSRLAFVGKRSLVGWKLQSSAN
jgi:hypothetical protein